MRWLMWFTIGFAGACLLSIYALPSTVSTLWLIPAFVGIISCILGGKRLRVLYAAATVLMGCTGGMFWFSLYHGQYRAVAQHRSGTVRDAVIIATDFSRQTDYGYCVDGCIEFDGKSFRVTVYLEEDFQLRPGDRLDGTFRLRYTTAKAGERISHYQGKGIYLLADQKSDLRIKRCEDARWQYYPAIIAKGIDGILKSAFPEDTYGFAKALLLGDSSGLDYSTDADLRISGIRHVIAVSGLHVSMLYALIRKLTGRNRFLTALLGFPVLFIFAAVAGFTPSVTRAGVMVGLMILAELINKEYDPPTALSFACLVMLVGNPMIASSVSFQLSVGCVAGILMCHAPIEAWMNQKLPVKKHPRLRALSTSAAITISSMTFTVPLSAVYFGTVSAIGVLTNILTLWVVTVVFVGILAICLTSLVWAKGAAALGWFFSWPIRYILMTAKLLSRAPLAAVYTDSVYIVLWLIFCYTLTAVFALDKKRSVRVLLCCMALGLCLCLGCSWLEPLLDGTRVTVLDVGQGQCILVQTKGKTFLVDCGSNSPEEAADALTQKLYSQGIRSLDAVFLTHCDKDHAGAAGYVLDRIRTQALFLPATESDFLLPEGDYPVVWVDRETLLTVDGCSIRIYPPVFSVDSNENSLCILFDTESCDILITGDRSGKGERLLLKRFDVPPVDLLIAGHHGSAKAVSEELLQAVKPETVIISVGRDNPYGHPAEQTLMRLTEFGCQIYRTDLHGTIIYRR